MYGDRFFGVFEVCLADGTEMGKLLLHLLHCCVEGTDVESLFIVLAHVVSR